MRKLRKRILAFFYMPLIFTILGYSLLYLAIAPVLDMLQAAWGMILVDDNPSFKWELTSIYDPNQNIKQDELINTMGSTLNNNKVSVKDIQFPRYGDHFAYLSCKRIKLEAPIYWGDNDEILKVGVGQYPGSFLPGFHKSILISGHNTTYFSPLQFVELGDIIICTTNYGLYQYEVKEIQVIHVDDAKNKLDNFLSYQDETLILYTCYPFETLVGTKMERLFVFAEKISGFNVE